jgi:hypothetical protein
MINGRLGGRRQWQGNLANPRALEDKDRDMPTNEIMWTERGESPSSPSAGHGGNDVGGSLRLKWDSNFGREVQSGIE